MKFHHIFKYTIVILATSTLLVAFLYLSQVGALSKKAEELKQLDSLQRGWSLLWSDEFNSGTINPLLWKTLHNFPDHPEWSQYNAMGVSTTSTSLDLVSRRHCLTLPGEITSYANQNSQVCPKGTTTAYSSGRIETAPILQSSFKVVFRAKVPEKPIAGMRTALWLKNERDYCIEGSESDTGEFDALEWYSSNPKKSTATTHVNCKDGMFDSSYHGKKYKTDLAGIWHEWSVIFRDGTISYYIDDEPVKIVGKNKYIDSKETFKKTTQTQFDAALTQPWAIILNSEVMGPSSGSHKNFRPPSAKKPFPVQHFYVDYVRVYSL